MPTSQTRCHPSSLPFLGEDKEKEGGLEAEGGEEGKGEPSSWSGLHRGKFSAYWRQQGIVKLLLGREHRDKGVLNVPCISKGHLYSCFELSPTARRSGHPQGSLEAHYASGKRSQVSGVRREVPGLLPNFPAYKPSGLPCRVSLHVSHTPWFWVWTNNILPWQGMT